MYPRETCAFSTPPRRAGNPKNASLRFLLRPLFNLRLSKDYWAGSGVRTVILVDNVRDDQFYDTDNANTMSRIGGFYSRTFSELLDRHIMSIDSWDWAEPHHGRPSAQPVF